MIKLDAKGVAVLVGGAFVLLYLMRQQAGELAAAVNPVDHGNVFHTGANAVGEALTGDKHFALGTWAYELINGEG